jgi:hypothetical protein
VLAAEHLLGLAGLDIGFQRVERRAEIGRHLLAGASPLDEDTDVVAAPLERVAEIDVVGDALAALQRSLGVGGVVPEIGRGDPRLEPAQFFIQTGRVKDSS